MKMFVEKRHRSAYGGHVRPKIAKKAPFGRILSQVYSETTNRVTYRHATRKPYTRTVRSLGIV